MNLHKKRIEQIIDEFFQGKESRVGRELFNSWYDDLPNNMPEADSPEKVKKEIFDNVKRKVSVKDPSFFNGYAKKSKSMWPAVLMKVAASVLLVISVGVAYYYHQAETRPVADTIVEKVRVNERGERSTFRLPDGTIVKLNADSKLTILSDYGNQKREVFLEGEAFFDVYEDPQRPFKVHTGEVTTTALGTSFNVRAFDTDTESRRVEVSLVTGKVRISGNNARAVLQPGEQVVVNSDRFVKQSFDSEKVLAWKEGFVCFNDTGFLQIANELERWYDVDIEIAGLDSDKANRLKGTGRFNTQKQTLKAVLEVLSHSMHFDYTIENKKVIINF